MERMNYINKDKNNMTDAERIRYLEESIRELRKEKENLKKEKGELKSRLEEENKKLKKYYDRDKEELMESCYGLAKENDELKKELEETKNTLDHRDSFFSIMRDVLANETITNNEIAMIIYCVVHEECGDYDLSKKELKIAKEFWERKYV